MLTSLFRDLLEEYQRIQTSANPAFSRAQDRNPDYVIRDDHASDEDDDEDEITRVEQTPLLPIFAADLGIPAVSNNHHDNS